MLVHKVTLSSGKTILIRDIEMRDEELAAQAASQKAGDSPAMLGYLMQNEMVKNLIVDIDGKKLSAVEREGLNKILSYAEWAQLRKVMGKLMGEVGAEPQIEFVNTGEQSPG